MARKIILDVDTGSDDAVAIMSAILAENIQLEAICSVAGNKELDMTTENTLLPGTTGKVPLPGSPGEAEPWRPWNDGGQEWQSAHDAQRLSGDSRSDDP